MSRAAFRQAPPRARRTLNPQLLSAKRRHVRRKPQADGNGQNQVVMSANARVVRRPARVGYLALEILQLLAQRHSLLRDQLIATDWSKSVW